MRYAFLVIVGLTGGIASGKSTVGRMLRAAGVNVVDADELAREVVAPGSAGLAEIVGRFGDGVLLPNGSLDRKGLGAVVFADESARQALNAITHPRVAALAMERLSAASGDVVYEVPLLFESHLEGMMGAVILVAAPVDVQIARVMARDHLDEAGARARIAAQMPLAEKRKRATHVIENEGTLADVEAQLRVVWRAITGAELEFTPPAALRELKTPG